MVEAKKREEELLDRYVEQCMTSNEEGQQILITKLRNEMQRKEREIREVTVREERLQFFDELSKESRKLEL